MPEENEQTPPIDPLTIGGLISLAEAAENSGLSHDYLKKIARSGRLRAKKIGGTWLTTKLAIEEYKNSRSFKNIPKKYRDRS
jgi:excisionase family DNA binding protein